MTFEIAPLGLLVCMIVVVLFFYGVGLIGIRRHDDAEDHGLRIIHFRCSSCDCLWRSPPTPFNKGRHPLCMSCVERNFPAEHADFIKNLRRES